MRLWVVVAFAALCLPSVAVAKKSPSPLGMAVGATQVARSPISQEISLSRETRGIAAGPGVEFENVVEQRRRSHLSARSRPLDDQRLRLVAVRPDGNAIVRAASTGEGVVGTQDFKADASAAIFEPRDEPKTAASSPRCFELELKRSV